MKIVKDQLTFRVTAGMGQAETYMAQIACMVEHNELRNGNGELIRKSVVALERNRHDNNGETIPKGKDLVGNVYATYYRR